MFAKPLTLLFSVVLVSFGVLVVLRVIDRKLRFEGVKCKEVEGLWKSDRVHLRSSPCKARSSTPSV